METKILWEKPALFNNYVEQHPRGDVLQTTHWGELKESSGWTWMPLTVMKRGTIQGAALVLTKQLPLFKQATVAYSPRGPLYSSQEALLSLLDFGRQTLKDRGSLVWKMDPAIAAHDPLWLDVAKSQKLNQVDTGLDFDGVQPRFVMTLDLNASLDNILANMKSKTRYNIRYAERKGVHISRMREKKLLSIFYYLLQETAARDGFTIRPHSYFEAMWDALVQNNLAQVFIAQHQNTPLAGAICFRLGTRAWYVYGASSNENRNLQASHLIQWEMIKWAKSVGCKVYDFRGVSGDLNPEHPLYGLYRFKEGFGAQLESYVGEYDLAISKGGYTLWQGGLVAHNWIRQRKKRSH